MKWLLPILASAALLTFSACEKHSYAKTRALDEEHGHGAHADADATSAAKLPAEPGHGTEKAKPAEPAGQH